MVVIAHHLVVNVIGTGIRACWDVAVVSRAVKAILHRSAGCHAGIDQLLCRPCVGQCLCRGCRGDGGSGPFDCHADGRGCRVSMVVIAHHLVVNVIGTGIRACWDVAVVSRAVKAILHRSAGCHAGIDQLLCRPCVGQCLCRGCRGDGGSGPFDCHADGRGCRVSMVVIAHHLVVNVIGTGIRACWDVAVVSRAVKAILHRSAGCHAGIDQLLCRPCVGQCLCRGCRGDGGSGPFDCHADGRGCRVSMVVIAHHLVVNVIGTGIRACWDVAVVSRAVKAILHRSAGCHAGIDQLLCRPCVGQCLCRGCRGDGGSGPFDCHADGRGCRVSMVVIAHHLVVNVIGTGIRACWDVAVVSRAVKAILHRSAGCHAGIDQLLCRPCVGQCLCRGCRDNSCCRTCDVECCILQRDSLRVGGGKTDVGNGRRATSEPLLTCHREGYQITTCPTDGG